MDDMDAAGIKELVQGEEGTDVNVTFIRESKVMTLTITRGQVAMTVEGYQSSGTAIVYRNEISVGE